MRQQTVVAHPDSHAARDPPENQRHEKSLPGKKEQRGNRANVKCQHEAAGDPINFVVFAPLTRSSLEVFDGGRLDFHGVRSPVIWFWWGFR
jgi:hypothetical protein